MIAKLRGRLDSAGVDHLVVDVNGVGYLVFASSRTLDRLPKPGEEVSLRIDTHVGEDHIRLYGFLEAAERDWFRLLLTVQGVGARVGLALLSALTPEQILQAIAVNDPKMLARADGVGPKLAARIANELKDKTAHLSLAAITAGAPPATGAVSGAATGAAGDAVSALVNLGYGRTEAFTAVMKASRALGEGAALQALIPAALKELAA
ncbi:MAG: Holliday junction branch migration protein RuvA [Alphaproteobacteria bacterium]|nr:Holliday junction branch migration protein RuvA [Alphaproteobacteria bacterium]MBU0886715.1 Holliday junction branch migration protein RuvA [Alphaproteobacteria bacterium]MBU1812557.1 Holliday junction branch migration protein RuvA [Alphaproteobacteria bacterium]MBU2090067.1 Holliday junction branch migration protein RuvA [Alphaproteobacteria bacterium]